MAKYKKDARRNFKGVKLSDNELKVIEEIAQKDDLAIATVIRSHALMSIKAQEPLQNLARKIALYKATEKEEELLQDVKVLLEAFEIDY